MTRVIVILAAVVAVAACDTPGGGSACAVAPVSSPDFEASAADVTFCGPPDVLCQGYDKAGCYVYLCETGDDCWSIVDVDSIDTPHEECRAMFPPTPTPWWRSTACLTSP